MRLKTFVEENFTFRAFFNICVYTKKGRQHFGDLFLVSFIFSLFSEFLFEPLVECHVGTDFLLMLRLGKCQYVAR